MRLLLALALTAFAFPQQAALPDILGMRPGISAGDAYRMLKQHDPNGSIELGQVRIEALSAKPLTHSFLYSPSRSNEDFEFILVNLTLPPSPQTAWRITRSLRFPTGKQPLAATLLAALRQKYGQELPSRRMNSYFWAFDSSGRAMQQGRPIDFADCATLAGAEPNIIAMAGHPTELPAGFALYPDTGAAIRSECQQYVYVVAEIVLDGSDRNLVNAITVSVVDPGAGMRAGRATTTVAKNAANADRQRELNKAKQQAAPPF